MKCCTMPSKVSYAATALAGPAASGASIICTLLLDTARDKGTDSDSLLIDGRDVVSTRLNSNILALAQRF